MVLADIALHRLNVSNANPTKSAFCLLQHVLTEIQTGNVCLDLRSNLLTLDRVQACLTLFSLSRSLGHSAILILCEYGCAYRYIKQLREVCNYLILEGWVTLFAYALIVIN